MHEGLKVKVKNLIPGQNTRQLSVVGVNKIKDMIQTVGWIPHKQKCTQCLSRNTLSGEVAFVMYDFSELVGKVSAPL